MLQDDYKWFWKRRQHGAIRAAERAPGVARDGARLGGNIVISSDEIHDA
jgi:hypothetical protein